MFLSNFHSIRPPYESSQEEILEWVAAAHTQSEKNKNGDDEELRKFSHELKERLFHVGCKPSHIAKRGHVLADCKHREWDKMDVYRLATSEQGEPLGVRVKHYGEHADRVFEEFYKNIQNPPEDLIHVTCTGYSSPSGAQKLVSKRGWGQQTVVTHAYHMGCYGSIPALRMAEGFLLLGKSQVDLVHTEMCSLHANPSLHETDQLVTQSLFADGFIKYTLSKEKVGNHLALEAVREEIISHSTQAMTWDVVEYGFQMSLSKEVVVLIARSIEGYLERLATSGKRAVESLRKKALFAVHPGGPKILTHVQQILGLEDWQMKYSFEILKQYGNMSSATLPHIWKSIVENPAIEEGTPIVSLAFGPGLTIAGALLEKRCSGQP